MRPHIHALVLSHDDTVDLEGLEKNLIGQTKGRRVRIHRAGSEDGKRNRYSLNRFEYSLDAKPVTDLPGALSYILKPQAFYGKPDGYYAELCAAYTEARATGAAFPYTAKEINDLLCTMAEHFVCSFKEPHYTSNLSGCQGCLYGGA